MIEHVPGNEAYDSGRVVVVGCDRLGLDFALEHIVDSRSLHFEFSGVIF